MNNLESNVQELITLSELREANSDLRKKNQKLKENNLKLKKRKLN